MNTIKLFGITLSLFVFASCGNQSTKNDETPAITETSNINQNTKTDIEEMGLKGKVNVIKQEEFYSSNENSEIGLKTGYNSFSYKFDNNGIKTEEQYYDSIGMIKEKSEYIYSNDKSKIGKKIFDLNNTLLHYYQYEFNEIGQIIKINIVDYENNEKFQYYSTSEYDNNGNEILTSTFAPDGKKVQSAEYTFEGGKKIKLVLKDNLDSPYAICEYQYNDKGDVIKEIFYTGNNMLFEEYSATYTYDSQNNWIKKIYSLEKKHMNSSGNASRKLGIQTITMRTITYH